MQKIWIWLGYMNLKLKKNLRLSKKLKDKPVIVHNSQNQIVAINPTNGEEIWSFDVIGGIAAKRGIILFDPKNDKSLPTAVAQKEYEPRLYFTNNRRKLYSLNAYSGELIKSFGKNGVVRVGVNPIPPLIYKDELILIDTHSKIVGLDLFTGKIKWKYKINKGKNSLLFANFLKESPLISFQKRGLMFINQLSVWKVQ